LNIVLRNELSVEKSTVNGKLFHIFLTRSAKKSLRMLAVHRGLNNYCGLVCSEQNELEIIAKIDRH